jgi:type I restriction enzyme S subunit
MTQWRTARLEDIAQVLGGGTPSRTEKSYFGGGIAWATPTDITKLDQLYIGKTKETVSEAGLHNSSTKLMQPGAVLLTSRATIGFTAVSTVPICTNQGFINFVCGPEIVPEYLAYWLGTQKAKMIQHAGGTTFKEIARGTLRKFEMPVPPLDEQRRIVDILSRAEGIVRLRCEAQRKAAELVPGIFLDMFGDPATNPKGWPEHRLGDIAEVVSGVTKGRKFGERETVEVPYLRVANVQAGHIDLSVVKTIEVLPKEVEQLALQRGDVVLTEGGDFDKLGRGALWEHDIANCIHQNHVFRVRLVRSAALPEFFVTYLQARKAREYFLHSAKRTTNLASINMTQLRALPVVLPSLDVQHEFVEHFNATRSIQSQQAAATVKAEATFAALLAQAFSTTST